MLHLITGLPGASKSLNGLKELVSEKAYSDREIYYNNIKLLMLDFEVVESFSGWFYGVWLPSLIDKERDNYTKIVLNVHKDDRYVEVSDVPHLEQRFRAWFDSAGYIDLWLYWVNRLYPASVRQSLTDFLSVNDSPTKEQLQRFNLDFRHFHSVTDWYNLPNGSVILIDECQHWFPPRGQGAKVPRHVSEFETHRHKGFDVYLITQNAKLLDNNIRRLAGRHIHYQNNFGTNSITRFETQKVTDFDDYFGRQSADKKTLKRDKKYYGVYHSADVHTHKVRIPKKIYVLMILFVAVAGLFTYIFLDFSSRGNQPPKNVESSQAQKSVKSFQVQKSSTNSVPVIRDVSSINDFNHPLKSRCSSLEYAGSEKIVKGSGRSVKIKHYINCNTGDMSSVSSDDDGDSDDNDSKKADRVYEVTELIPVNKLTVLGYELSFIRGVPVLVYQGKVFALNTF